MASPDANDLLGVTLEERYGGDKPQDLHLDLFYLILGNEIVDKRDEIMAKLHQEFGIKEAGALPMEEWPEFLIIEFPKISLDEAERQREERLNDTIRKPLIAKFTQDPRNPPNIIISRVCKYTQEVTAKNNLTTLDVETALCSPFNQHLDYFYMFIRSRIPSEVLTSLLETKERKIWKKVSPEGTWPLTLLGHFPKQQFESECEREWRLNVEVRLPLKRTIEENIKLKSPELVGKTVIVMFTRVCQYSNM